MVGANSTVKVICNCVQCRSFRIRVGEQKTANLPACRSKEVAPFTHCGGTCLGCLESNKEEAQLSNMVLC